MAETQVRNRVISTVVLAAVSRELRAPAACINSGSFDVTCVPLLDPAPSGAVFPGAVTAAGDFSAGTGGASESGPAGIATGAAAGAA